MCFVGLFYVWNLTKIDLYERQSKAEKGNIVPDYYLN
jgi:hypothetical protein